MDLAPHNVVLGPSSIIDRNSTGFPSIAIPNRETPATVRKASAIWTATNSATGEMARVLEPGKVCEIVMRACARPIHTNQGNLSAKELTGIQPHPAPELSATADICPPPADRRSIETFV